MVMTKIPKFPRKMEELLGNEGKDEFIDFLNDSFHHQEDNVLQVVSDRFDRRVTEEIGKVNQSISLLDKRVTEEISGVRLEISGLRMEMHDGMNRLDKRISDEISGVKVQIADLKSDLKSDIADIHKSISSQTKWLLAVILTAATLISLVQPIMMKLLKIG